MKLNLRYKSPASIAIGRYWYDPPVYVEKSSSLFGLDLFHSFSDTSFRDQIYLAAFVELLEKEARASWKPARELASLTSSSASRFTIAKIPFLALI